MAAPGKIQFLILLSSLSYYNLALGFDYVMSQSDNILDGGIVLSPTAPLFLQNGDTLTIKNGKSINFNPLVNGSMIVAYGNNTITLETGSSIKSTQVVTAPANTNVIKFAGTGSSSIIINPGATLQASDASSAVLWKANIFSGGNETVTLINSGTIIGPAYFNKISKGDNSLILLGAAVAVQSQLNSIDLSSAAATSKIWVGGQINSEGKTTLTTTNYTTTSDYYPFTNVRIFSESSMTLATQTLSSPAVTNNLQIDATASFTLTGAPSGAAGLSFVVNNVQNDGTLTLTNQFTNNNFRTLQVGNLVNNNMLNISNGSHLAGIDQAASVVSNTSLGSINVASGALTNFNIFKNAGSITVNATLSNINSFYNVDAGLLSLMAGSTVANIGAVNNGNNSSFQVNGATFSDVASLPNYQKLTVDNDGSFVISAGSFNFLEFNNNNLLTISGGMVSGYGAVAATIINGVNATLDASAGSMRNVDLIENYGKIKLSGVITDNSVVKIYNYGLIEHSAGDLLATNVDNRYSGTYNLTGSASIIPPVATISIKNNGVMLANTTGKINCAIENGSADAPNASLTISALSSINNITNNAFLTINGPVSLTPQSSSLPSIANNHYMLLNGADIEVTTAGNPIVNGGESTIDITGPVFLNFSAGGADVTTGPNRYANFTNRGVINLKAINGTINYVNAGDNILYVGELARLNVFSSTTLNGANYTNYGTHYTYINSEADPSTFTINGNANLENCAFKFDVNPALSGTYSFKILNSNSITNFPSSGADVDTFLLKKSMINNGSMIFVNYYRKKTTDFELSKNARQLAMAIEKLLEQQRLTNPDLNKIYTDICSTVTSEQDLEKYLTNMLPVVTAPVQNSVMQQTVNLQINNRMQATRVAYNSADYPSGFSPWVRVFATKNRQAAVKNNLGYKFRSQGLVLGMDNYDGVTTQYGVSLTFANSLLEQQLNLPSKAKTHFYQANIYGQNIFESNYYTDWILGLAYSATNQSRFDGNTNRIAYSKYNWQQYSGKYEVGYIFDVRKELYIVPYVSGHYSFYKNYQYQEYNDHPNNLFIVSPTKHIFEVGLGVRSDMHLLLYNRDFIPKLMLGVKYCLSSPIYNIESSILDQNIAFQTFTRLPRLKYYSGLGATLEIVDNLILAANVELELYNKYLGSSYNFTLRYIF